MKKREFISLGVLIVLVAILFIGCSSDDDPTTPPPDGGTTETIGAAGGSIELANEASMSIPAAALDSNIDFTMADAGSNHQTMVSVRTLGSNVYSIGPSGTTFNNPVQLVLHYNEEDLNGVAESSIIIYTDAGSGWMPLPTTVNEVANTATAEITHLSDFAVTTPAGETAEGVYGIFEVVRLVNYVGEGIENQHSDIVLARFDGVVNMCSPVEPMHPDSVYCNTFGMSYDDMILSYIDENPAGVDFLALGETYTYHVIASDDVPALEPSIAMVDHEPAITNIDDMDAVSIQGFTVHWNDTSAGNVNLTLALSRESIVSKEVPNNGSYTFTASDLVGLNTGTYVLTLINHQKTMLDDAPGYDPNSYITSYTQDVKLVYLSTQSGLIGSGGGTIMLGDDGHLSIPAGALDENVLFEAEIDTDPIVGLENYTLLSPVYSIEPSGTDFDTQAIIRFNYLEATVGDALEEDILIFTNSGSGWDELSVLVFEDENYVEAEISHLSRFVAAVPTPTLTEGIFAVLEVSTIYTNQGSGVVGATDLLFARFDEVVDDDQVTPLQAESASFGEWEMVWSEDSYSYVDYVTPAFLSLGHSYDFEVVANAAVPVLDIPIVTLSDEVYVTNLEITQEMPLSGFTLEWNGSTLGSTVNIVVAGYGGSGLNIDVANTGTYTFTEAELSVISAGGGLINLYWEKQLPIVATGYDNHSHVLFSTSNSNNVVFTEEVVTQEVTYTETPYLVITDRIDGQPVTPVTDTINVTATGTVDSIRVYVNITHNYSSDLTIKLRSPSGLEYRVFWIGEGGEPQVNPVGWYPDDFTPKDDLNGFDGQNINGEWTLTATDNSFGQVGTLNEWRLQFFYVE